MKLNNVVELVGGGTVINRAPQPSYTPTLFLTSSDTFVIVY